MTKIIIPDSIHRAEAEAAVRQILSGRGLEAVAAQFADRGMDIRKFLRECGAPNNRMRLRTALATLEAGTDDPDLDLPDTPEPEPELAVDQDDDLIDRGKASDKPSTVRLAERIEQLLDRLRSDLQAQEKERANADEIARLQQRIAELRGIDPKQTRPKSGAKAKSDNAKVREWAASNGIDCPAHGRVPQAVRERYENRAEA